jgi:AcrR family transcriptional regulator
MTPVEPGVNGRDAQRQQTRERVYEAAIAEYRRSGMAAADVGAITRAAGVARGTFYFHFPTKEHVLAELERGEEVRVAARFRRFLAHPHDLRGTLEEVVRLFLTIERRAGKTLFREMLGLHFSSARPDTLPGPEEWTAYPFTALLFEEFDNAQRGGEIYAEAQTMHSAGFFLLGLYAALITSHEQPRAARQALLDNFVTTVLRSVESR